MAKEGGRGPAAGGKKRGPEEAPSAPGAAEAWRRRYLAATVFLSGAAVMVLELLGTRLLAPVFGLSLYVWTAVITVTLVALAAGYWFGGTLADRRPEAGTLYLVLAAVAISLALLVLAKGRALDWMSGMGPRSGPLAGSALLLLVPLFGLATVPPFAVRLTAKELGKVGGAAGRVSALSTLGSVAGSIATGFYLIPEVGVGLTLACLAAGLLALAVAGFVLSRRHGRAALAGAAGILFLLPAMSPYLSRADRYPVRVAAGGGFETRLLAERSSPYAELKVADVVFPTGWRARWMFIGQAPQTFRFEKDYLDRKPYYVDSVHLVEGFHPAPERYLVIGLGGGEMTELLRAKPGASRVDVVEIDPEVVELAREFFGFEEGGPLRLFVQDGRDFVRREAPRGGYDLVFFDAFGAGTAPFHLFSLEALREFRAVLAPGGLFVMNYLGFSGGPNRASVDSILRTVGEVFPSSRVILGGEPGKPDGFANYLVVASDAPVRLARHPFRYLSSPLFRSLVAKFFAIHVATRREAKIAPGESLPGDPEELEQMPLDRLDAVLDVGALFDPEAGRLVTDDSNWLDVANVAQNEAHRKAMLPLFRELLLGR
ncbi:MAG: fused MFS/spermidine synthase [Planctomycetes bacterium]|nr:fused MFS/spermidine synthase [Planctomycetota bacterium]